MSQSSQASKHIHPQRLERIAKEERVPAAVDRLLAHHSETDESADLPQPVNQGHGQEHCPEIENTADDWICICMFSVAVLLVEFRLERRHEGLPGCLLELVSGKALIVYELTCWKK